MCLVVDAIIDFVSSVVIPLAVYVDYRQLLAKPLFFDASWNFTAGSDLVEFVPNSILAILSRMLPSMSMILNLHVIKPVLKSKSAEVMNASAVSPLDSHEDMMTPHARKQAQLSIPVTSVERLLPRRWIRYVHTLFVIIGLSTIVLVSIGHRDAAAEGLPQCKLVMSRWLVPRVPCAVLDIDCESLGTTGHNSTSLDKVLGKAEPAALRALSFVNCRALVIPDKIRDFPKLNWLEIRNSTVISWPLTAALTSTSSPILSRLLIVHTNFTDFPLVLYSEAERLSSTLLDVSFAHTNLTDVPPNLHEVWPQPMASVHFEHCHFTEIPTALLAMRSDALSLAYNAISVVPPSLFEGKSFSLLSLSGNPISQLPDHLITNFHIRASLSETQPRGLWLVNTAVSSLPPWLQYPESCKLTSEIFAEHTPLCSSPPDASTTDTSRTACTPSSSSLLHCDASSSPHAAISSSGSLVQQ